MGEDRGGGEGLQKKHREDLRHVINRRVSTEKRSLVLIAGTPPGLE